MTWSEKMTEAREAYEAERIAYREWFDAAVAAKYAEMRAEDKAAGRDTSGKSVARRRTVAYDIVMMSDEARERRERVDAAEATYRAVVRGA